jgi:hypothetical protein
MILISLSVNVGRARFSSACPAHGSATQAALTTVHAMRDMIRFGRLALEVMVSTRSAMLQHLRMLRRNPTDETAACVVEPAPGDVTHSARRIAHPNENPAGAAAGRGPREGEAGHGRDAEDDEDRHRRVGEGLPGAFGQTRFSQVAHESPAAPEAGGAVSAKSLPQAARPRPAGLMPWFLTWLRSEPRWVRVWHAAESSERIALTTSSECTIDGIGEKSYRP